MAPHKLPPPEDGMLLVPDPSSPNFVFQKDYFLRCRCDNNPVEDWLVSWRDRELVVARSTKSGIPLYHSFELPDGTVPTWELVNRLRETIYQIGEEDG